MNAAAHGARPDTQPGVGAGTPASALVRLDRMVLHVVSLPRRRDHTWAKLQGSIGTYLLVELTSADGLSGWGEATVLGSWGGDHGRYYGETLSTARHVLADLIAPRVLGHTFTSREEVLALASGAVAGHPYAKTAFECAVLDLWGRTLGVPVHELIGGRRRDRIRLTHSLGLMDPEVAVAEARDAVAEGISTIKVKVGVEPERDVALVHDLHDALGSGVDLVLDANQGWRTAAVAERVLRRMADVPVHYVEQPVEGLAQMVQLAPRIPFPLMADESMWNSYDMADLARTGVVPYASIYTSKAGGVGGAMVADAVASAFGIGTNVNGSGETGIGNLANVHLAAAMRSLTECSALPASAPADLATTKVAGRFYTDDVIAEPLRIVDGCLVVPDGPGWGIDVDPDRLAAHRTSQEEVLP